ncbi:MAG: hypothetical protein WBA73_13975 [Devosia sp.]
MTQAKTGKAAVATELAAAAGPEKACKACASQIPRSAKLCKECSTYQGGWRSWISVSQTTLALTVALISVATAAVPGVSYAIWGNRSDLRADFWQFDGDLAVFTISNPGDKAGFVDRVTLQAQQESGTTGIDLVRNGPDRVNPGEIFRLQFMMHPTQGDLALTLFKSRSSDVCYLRILLREYDGSPKQVREPIVCREAFAHLALLHRTEILALPDIELD